MSDGEPIMIKLLTIENQKHNTNNEIFILKSYYFTMSIDENEVHK